MRPAPTSSTIDSATSATSSSAPAAPRPPLDPRAPSFRTSFRSTRDARSAGSRPNTRLEATEIAERESEHARVDVDVAQQLREAGRHDEREEARAPERQCQAEAAADEREQQVLGEELLHEAPAAGAGGGAQRQLLLPGRPGGQQQVGDVGAGDQQHEADGAEQERQSLRRVAEEGLVQRHDLAPRCRRPSRRVPRAPAG